MTCKDAINSDTKLDDESDKDEIDFYIAQDMVTLRTNDNLIYLKFLFAALCSRFFQTQVDAYYVVR
jgi:hypothetical protein